MRVISGTQKGRILKAVPGDRTRPTTDKVKEAVFNMIGPYFDGGTGLDLFAGSGGLGIEGLSRGLEKVVFVDRNYRAVQTVKSNLDICGFREKAEVYKNDWKRALNAIIQRNLSFRVIWLDPPYNQDVYINILEKISEHGLLDPDGVVVCEHALEDKLPDTVQSLERKKHDRYGTVTISIYQHARRK